MKKQLLEQYNILLEEKRSIDDNYWESESWIDQWWDEWQNENLDNIETMLYGYITDYDIVDFIKTSKEARDIILSWLADNDHIDVDSLESNNFFRVLDNADLGDDERFEMYDTLNSFQKWFDENRFKDLVMDGTIGYDATGYWQVLDTLRSLPDSNGDIRIYRAMDVPEDYEEHLIHQGKHLGIYWTWDDDAPEVYSGANHTRTDKKVANNQVVLYSKVAEEVIDWRNTILLNTNYVLGDDEREIRLIKGTPLKLLLVQNFTTGEEVDISNVRDKTFYA